MDTSQDGQDFGFTEKEKKMCFKGMREINVKHNDDGTVTALVRFGSDEALNAWLHAIYAI